MVRPDLHRLEHLRNGGGSHYGDGGRIAHHRGVIGQAGHGDTDAAAGFGGEAAPQDAVHSGGIEQVVDAHSEQCEQLMADAGAEQLFDRSVPDQFFQPGAGKPRCVKSGDTCSGAAGVVTVDPDSGSFERLKHAGGGLDLAASAARDHGENWIGHDKFSC